MHALYYGPRHRMAFRVGTYLALIRMMGIGHLVTSLYGHSRLLHETHARLARTRQTLADLICHGFDSPTGQAALQRLCHAHRGVQATADDYRYVLGTFFLEPLRWNDGFGRQALSAEELDTLLSFWHRIGQAMGIDALPTDLAGWRQLQQAYEAQHLRPTREGRHLARLCLQEVVRLTVPFGTRWMFRAIMRSTMEARVRDTLGIEPARGLLRWIVRIGWSRGAQPRASRGAIAGS